MSYGFPPQQTQQVANRIVRRPLTDMEMGFVANTYKSLQRGLMIISIIALLLFVTTAFVLWDISLDWTVFFALEFSAFVLGVLALVLAATILRMRKQLAETYREGTAIEVQGLAYSSRAMKNAPMWTVGPISITSTPEVSRLITQGALVSILCVPKMKIAISVNGTPLRQGARITVPPNLESFVTQANQPAQQPMPQPIQAQYPQNYPPAPQPQTAAPSYEPPPPPPDQ